MDFLIATHNMKKRDELYRILSPLGIDVKTSDQLGIEITDVDETGRPLYKPKDVIADLKSISEARKQVQLLEAEYKSSLSAASSVRGGVELGFDEA